MDSWTWVYLTLMASAAQAVRTGGQKHLTAHLSPIAVTFVRFLYGLPFAILYFLVIQYVYDKPFPSLSPTFLGFTLAMGITQITATALLIHLFSLRNFATGTTYARTEAFLTAVVSALFFNEVIQLQGWVAIGVHLNGFPIKADGGWVQITRRRRPRPRSERWRWQRWWSRRLRSWRRQRRRCRRRQRVPLRRPFSIMRIKTPTD